MGNIVTSAQPISPVGAKILASNGWLAPQTPVYPGEAANKWFGSVLNNVSYNQTSGLSSLNAGYGLKLEAEAHFDAVRLVWINRAANAINNCTALVAVTETAELDTAAKTGQPVIGGTAYGQLAPAGSILGWRSVTWAGSSAVSIPAANTAVQYGVSDWIPLSSIARADGGSRPLLMIRLQHNGSVDGSFAFLGASYCSVANRTGTTASRGRIIQATDNASGVSTPSNNGTIGTTTFEVFPVFRHRVPTLSVVVCGDSIVQNDSLVTNTITSWGWRGCCDASSTNRPVTINNLGCSGKGFAEYWARCQELINSDVPIDVLVIEPATTNDGYSNLDRTFETARSRALEIVAFCKAKGIRHLCFLPLFPNNIVSGADSYRKAYNNFLLTLSGSTSVSFLPMADLGDGANPERYKTEYDYGDHVHPNETAIDSVMAPALAAYLNRIY